MKNKTTDNNSVEGISISDAWHQWVNEFHYDLISPDRYRPPSFGKIFKNGVQLPSEEYNESQYTLIDATSARLKFETLVHSLSSFDKNGKENSPGQWRLGSGGFEKIIFKDDKRNDGGAISWPALVIKRYDENIFLKKEDFQTLLDKERNRHSTVTVENRPPTDETIQILLREQFGDHLPSADKCFEFILARYPMTKRLAVRDVHRALTGGRERGRPSKLPK